MINTTLKYIFISLLFVGCNFQKNKESKRPTMDKKTISKESMIVRDYLKKDMVIAHRGTTYWAPEETEAAFLWARNIGADYLEFDVQLTKDTILIAFHDSNLSRTTNVSELFPERIESEINEFTLKELRSLDAGSWFNKKNPERAKESFIGLNILTLKETIMIAEGNRILKKDGKPVKELIDGIWNGNYLFEKDPNDNGNRPGIYVETKNPKPTTEKILAKEISEYGWNINTNPKTIKTTAGKIAIANTNARFVLQSFQPESIERLEKYLPNIPKCMLIWQGRMEDDLKGNYHKVIDFCIKNNVQIIGPNKTKKPSNFEDLVHKSGMAIHTYTFDTIEELEFYKGRIDGVFTNRADLALEFYNRKSNKSSQDILTKLGY